MRTAPPDFHVLAGDDAFMVPTILMGGSGAILAAAHVCTKHFASMVEASLSGDVLTARSISEALLPLIVAGFNEPNPALWKAALHRLGEVSTPNLRSPMSNASVEGTDRIMEALRQTMSALATATNVSPTGPAGR